MKCGECVRGRRFAQGSVFCVMYGVIISEDHECGLEGGKRHEGADNQREDGGGEAEGAEDDSGTA